MATSVPTEVLSRFQHLFRGRENIYGVTQLDKKTGEKIRSFVEHAAPSEREWRGHLTGASAGIGIGPSTLDNACYFGAIDWDEPSNHAAFAQIVDHAGLPLVVCRSKSGGTHFFVFLRDPAPAKVVMGKLREWTSVLGIPKRTQGPMAGQPTEVFPKNAKLKTHEDGNWINLPYYSNGTTNRYAVLADGTRLGLTEFIEYAEQSSISSFELASWVVKAGTRPFDDGPPCLQTLDQLGYPEGARNTGLLNVAIYLKLRDTARDDGDPDKGSWTDELVVYNDRTMQPPLEEREVLAVAKQVEKRDYSYKCLEQPIAPHCQKPACKKQPFGIDVFRKKHIADHMPAVDHLRRLQTDPPRWLLTVAGQEVSLATEDLMLLPRFRKTVLERCSKIFPLMKQGDWDEHLSRLLETCVDVEAPEDAGVIGQFHYLLREFLMRRKNSETREDLLSGMPYQEGPRVLFRSADLMGFLERKKFKEYTAGQVFDKLRASGVGVDRLNIKGATIRVWMLPVPQDEQTEEFTAKDDKEPPY